jgi:hypothetical protein
MNTSRLFTKRLHLLGTLGVLMVIGHSASASRIRGLSPFPEPSPEHDGKTTTVPAIIVGSGPHNLRVWSESVPQKELNVLLGGLHNYEYVAQVNMIDLRGNSIVDQSVETPNGFLNMQLTSEDPLPQGIYLLTIRTSDRSWTERVVVE